jgi:hypothetical protein
MMEFYFGTIISTLQNLGVPLNTILETALKSLLLVFYTKAIIQAIKA